MDLIITLAIVAGWLIGTGGVQGRAKPADSSYYKRVWQENKEAKDQVCSIVALENAVIAIPPGAEITLQGIKTKAGPRIRFEAAGVIIEATRLSIKSDDTIYHYYFDPGSNQFSLIAKKLPRGEP